MTYDFLKLKVQNILQNFKNKENAARLQLSKIVSSHLHPVENSKRLLSSIFVFHRHAAETGSISEYNLKEATKSHIIVNY